MFIWTTHRNVGILLRTIPLQRRICKFNYPDYMSARTAMQLAAGAETQDRITGLARDRDRPVRDVDQA